MKFLRIALQIVGNLRGIFTLIILTRLVFLENIPAATFLEILSGMVLLITPPAQGGEDSDHD